jgi:hypothetical protein
MKSAESGSDISAADSQKGRRTAPFLFPRLTRLGPRPRQDEAKFRKLVLDRVDRTPTNSDFRALKRGVEKLVAASR